MTVVDNYLTPDLCPGCGPELLCATCAYNTEMARLYRLVMGLLDGLPSKNWDPGRTIKCLGMQRSNSNRPVVHKVVAFAAQANELIDEISRMFGEDLRQRWQAFQGIRKSSDLETGRRAAVLSMTQSRLRHIAREVKDHESAIHECMDHNGDIASLVSAVPTLLGKAAQEIQDEVDRENIPF